MLEIALTLVIAFLIGSFPTAYIAGRVLSGEDMREVGSGNPGALNTARRVGVGVGIAVLLIDAGKGILAVFIALQLSVDDMGVYASAFLVTLGHNFSPFTGFRGGKGAASVLGISAFMLWHITAITFAVGLVVYLTTRQAVVSMTAVFIVLNALTIVTGQSTGQIVLCILLSMLVAGTHLLRERKRVSSAVRDRDWRRFMSIE